MLSTIELFALGAAGLVVVGIVIAVWLLGTSGKAARRGDTNVSRYAIGPRLVGVPMGLGLLWLAGFIVASAAEEGLPSLGNIFLLSLVTAFFAGMGALGIIKPLFAHIQYDREEVCATMDGFFNRRHCHRWAELTQVEDDDKAVFLHFSDGGKVTVGVGMTGHRDLHDYAIAVLERRNDDEAQ